MTKTNSIQITLLANEGIILQFGETKCLIDGLHDHEDGMFSSLSKPVIKDLLTGKKPLFRNIDYLLFTHCHPDHFSAELTEKYLSQHQLKGLLLPDRQTLGFTALREVARHQSDRTWLLDLPLGEKKRIELEPDVAVTVFRSKHAGLHYVDVENFCYLLNLGGRQVFMIADADYDADYFSQILAGEKIEIALVNPLFLNKSAGREVITKALKPDQIVVYHIPFTEHDGHGFRKLVPYDVKKHQDKLPPITVLWNELQEISF